MSLENQLQRIADAFDKLIDIQVVQLEALEKYVDLVEGALKKFDSPPQNQVAANPDEVPAFIPVPPPGLTIIPQRSVKELERMKNNFGFTLVKSLKTIAENLQERRWRPGPNTFQMLCQQYNITEGEVHSVIRDYPALHNVFSNYPQTGYK